MILISRKAERGWEAKGFSTEIRRAGFACLRKTVEHGKENAIAEGGLPKVSAMIRFQDLLFDGTYLFILLSNSSKF